MDMERLKQANGKEILEMMQEKVTEAIESDEDVTVREIGGVLREAIILGAVVIGAMTSQPLSSVMAAFATDAHLAELEIEMQLNKRRSDIAKNN